MDTQDPVTLALCEIAIRLFTTPLNSVWAERGFSEMNRTQNKARASLRNNKMNMLCSISINRRVLDHPHKKIHLLSEKEMNDLEADLLYLEAEDLQDTEYHTDSEIDRIFRQPGGLVTRNATGYTVSTLTGRGGQQLMHTQYEAVQDPVSTGQNPPEAAVGRARAQSMRIENFLRRRDLPPLSQGDDDDDQDLQRALIKS